MDEKPLNDFWKFNLKSRTWTGQCMLFPIVSNRPPYSFTRSLPCALYDRPLHPLPSAVKAKGGKPPSPRSFHKMIAINQVIFVFGGCAAKGRLADLHKFDTRTNIWTEVP